MQYSLKGNFTHIENFHLTLRFIGEIEPDKVMDMQKMLDEVAAMQQCFDINLSGIGFFPRGDKKVIWCGIEKNEKLKQLYKTLEQVLIRYGYEKEESEYKPHITLGREVILKSDVNKLKETISTQPIQTKAISLSLMESTRINGRLSYVPLYTRKLMD